MKDIDKYADWTITTAIYPEAGSRTLQELSYLTLGLNGEAGEVAEHVKKAIRDGTWNQDKVKKELGDVVYYWARMCISCGLYPSEVLDANMEKLNKRKEEGKIEGSGSNR